MSLPRKTITLSSSSKGQRVSVPDIVFGCGHNNTGFNEHEMGSVGRGGRPSSLTSRIGSYSGNIKFTHCLVPFHSTLNISSKMYSGDGSEIIGKGVVSTPLVRKKNRAYYYVALEGISVRGKFLTYSSSGTISKGNVFSDTATPPTILPKDFYNRLEQEVEQEVKNSIPVTPYRDSQLRTQLCYRGNTTTINAPYINSPF